MNCAQREVARFATSHGRGASLDVQMLDLVSEVGELAKEILSVTRYGQRPFEPSRDWEGELGDVFYSLIMVANSTGVDLEAALRQSLEKYQQRIERSGDPGSGK